MFGVELRLKSRLGAASCLHCEHGVVPGCTHAVLVCLCQLQAPGSPRASGTFESPGKDAPLQPARGGRPISGDPKGTAFQLCPTQR